MEKWTTLSWAKSYEVSDQGRVRHGARVLKICYSAYPKYGFVRINGRSCRVHKLVAEAFLPNSNGYTEVNHIDCDKTNNSADNLEWISHRENMRHAAASGRMSHSRAPRPVIAFYDNGFMLFDSIADAARFAHKPIQTIFAALRRGGETGGIRYAYQSEAERLIV